MMSSRVTACAMTLLRPLSASGRFGEVRSFIEYIGGGNRIPNLVLHKQAKPWALEPGFTEVLRGFHDRC
jgi:hypothetical protein